MNTSRVFVFAVSCVAVVVACGGGSGSTEAATSDSFADQYCATFAPCCQQANRPTDGATCKAFVTAAASGRQYDAAKGSSCLDQVHAAAAKPDFCKLANVDAPDCSLVYVSPGGGAAPGAPCKQDNDCASSPEGRVRCVTSFSGSSETRTCQVQVTGKDGDTPCVGTKDGNTTVYSFSSSSSSGTQAPPARGFVCNVFDGLRCDSKTTKCTRIQDVGGPCDGSSNACVKTAYCDATQKCAPRVGDGGACGTNGVSSSACVAGDYCDTTSKKCTPALADGAPCTTSTTCASNRCVNGKCDASSDSSFTLAIVCGGG